MRSPVDLRSQQRDVPRPCRSPSVASLRCLSQTSTSSSLALCHCRRPTCCRLIALRFTFTLRYYLAYHRHLAVTSRLWRFEGCSAYALSFLTGYPAFAGQGLKWFAMWNWRQAKCDGRTIEPVSLHLRFPSLAGLGHLLAGCWSPSLIRWCRLAAVPASAPYRGCVAALSRLATLTAWTL